MTPKFLTVVEASEYIRSTPGGIRNLVWRKKLRAYKPGKKLLIKREDLDVYVELSEKRGT